MFLSKQYQIKLGELGIVIEKSRRFEVEDTIYMSPEMINGESYSFNTDIWSLGCVVYELVYLKPAFKDKGLKRNPDVLEFNDSPLNKIIKR